MKKMRSAIFVIMYQTCKSDKFKLDSEKRQNGTNQQVELLSMYEEEKEYSYDEDE
jgi:hypothetical protein